ncbi:MAG: transcriptional regulator [Leptolyngbya sp. DLM2.Bin27]|nr:MAG: transcriptional regulator [Leptolyngbya sp. DLM2.Bin27]
MFATEPESYLQLLQKFPPRPIRTEEQFLEVQSIIDSLIDADELTSEQQDYLNLLGMLVHDYEERQGSIPDLSGIDLLRALMDEFRLKQKDLVPIFKTESIVSAVLNGQRNFTVEHIEKLADFFHISPAAFFPRIS